MSKVMAPIGACLLRHFEKPRAMKAGNKIRHAPRGEGGGNGDGEDGDEGDEGCSGNEELLFPISVVTASVVKGLEEEESARKTKRRIRPWCMASPSNPEGKST